MADLTDKQKRFVEEYLVDLNATQAAIRAGYSAKTAEQQGHQLLQKTSVSAAIEAAKAARSERTEVTQDYVLRSIQAVAENSMHKGDDGVFFDASAANKPLELLGKQLGIFTEKVALKRSYVAEIPAPAKDTASWLASTTR